MTNDDEDDHLALSSPREPVNPADVTSSALASVAWPAAT